MAIADLFTRPTAVPVAGGSAPASRAFGGRPAVAGAGLEELFAWVDEIAALTQPDRIHWVDGSRAENEALLAALPPSL